MIALRLILSLQILVIFQITEIFGYSLPIYGTKRYGRSNEYSPSSSRSSSSSSSSIGSSFDSYPSYQAVAPQHYIDPVNYYKLYPYSDSYRSNYYYPPQSYSVHPLPYYIPSKYKVYQPILPYYYQEHWPSQTYSTFYDYNDADEALQDTEREEREETQPIGHESYYEDANEDSNMDDVNAAFLQNLILTQIYQDSLNNKVGSNNYDDYDETFAKIEELSKQPTYAPEDETVMELKQLQKVNREKDNNKNKNSNVHWAQSNQESKQQRKNRQRKQKLEKHDVKRNSLNFNELPLPTKESSVYTERKPIIKIFPSTEAPSSTAAAAVEESIGQKEEFQMRPATPVRHSFRPVLAMMTISEKERKRTPSVYDTIKHLLDMEKIFENNHPESDLRPAMKKRIITPEESLTRQLSVLKKAQ